MDAGRVHGDGVERIKVLRWALSEANEEAKAMAATGRLLDALFRVAV
ncbi:hypothetical protein FAIPA1_50205 [Frankia sp. AiPs1]|nr:hypothetical protein [Frankia sp. AiPa1]MCL9762292.1 hypothetical protein [Frankia sp. AiPa1]